MSSFYFLGIGGTAMASVAVALSHAGHAISGSDTQLYPPMSNYLDDHNIRYFSGFSEKNLQSASPDVIVV
ncbi:MAG: UDP-N-acetylmuramate--alanine ligase, partial [Chlorobiaceae bacterium]|nr:UDP-N-acetylmuramate--alanine ligase [Chlorobiaceae bacterium]